MKKARSQVAGSRVEIMKRQAEGFKSLEIPQDAQPYGEQRATTISWLNELRAERGIAPLVNDETEQPALADKRRRANLRYQAERDSVQKQRRLRGFGLDPS